MRELLHFNIPLSSTYLSIPGAHEWNGLLVLSSTFTSPVTSCVLAFQSIRNSNLQICDASLIDGKILEAKWL